MEIQVTTPLYDTEDFQKLKDALSFMFPKISLEKKVKASGQEVVKGTSDDEISLSIFKSELKNREIRKLVEDLVDVQNHKFSFLLNKQDIIQEKISFTEEERPLGNVTLTIETKKDKEEFLDFLFS